MSGHFMAGGQRRMRIAVSGCGRSSGNDMKYASPSRLTGSGFSPCMRPRPHGPWRHQRTSLTGMSASGPWYPMSARSRIINGFASLISGRSVIRRRLSAIFRRCGPSTSMNGRRGALKTTYFGDWPVGAIGRTGWRRDRFFQWCPGRMTAWRINNGDGNL